MISIVKPLLDDDFSQLSERIHMLPASFESGALVRRLTRRITWRGRGGEVEFNSQTDDFITWYLS